MLANQEDFDRDVKRVLQEVNGEEIPLDFLVDIEQRLDQLEKKKKRRMFLWFFTGIVLASGLTFGLLRENGTSNISSKTATQKNPKDTIKAASIAPKVSPKEYKSIQVNTVQIVTTQPSGVTRNTLSNSPIKETVTRSTGGNQSDLLHATIPVESSTSVQTQQTIMESRQDAPVILSDQKSSISPSSDSGKVDSLIKNELAKEEVNPAVKIPEIVMNTDLPKWTHSFGFYTGMSGVISSFQTNEQALTAIVGATNALKYRELRSTQERSTSSIDISLRYRMAKEHLVLQTGVDFFEWGEQIQYDYSFAFDGVNRYSYLSLPVYLGGTLFEAFIVRNQFEDYMRTLDDFGIEYVEVSDGSIDLPHDRKCEYIRTLAKNYTVLSEVGSKDDQKIIPPYKWISVMKAELEAGSWKVIGEARESGNVGLFRSSGEVRSGLVEEILTQIPFESIIWEAPQKAQQLYFIELLVTGIQFFQ